MKIETLKKLIEIEYDNTSKMEIFKDKVFELLDLFEKDNINENIQTTVDKMCDSNKKSKNPPPPPPPPKDRIIKEGEKIEPPKELKSIPYWNESGFYYMD
jgi:hypothetical protein